jgi:hypothetical protein
MSNHDLLKPLYEVLERVQEMLRQAQAEEWEAMEAAASDYQQHVSFLNDNVYLQALQDEHLVEDAKAIILQIQTLNDNLDTYASAQRDKIASELRQMNQADKALDAYGR